MNTDIIHVPYREQGYYSFIIVFKNISNLINFSIFIKDYFLNVNDLKLLLTFILKVNQLGIITTNCTPDNILVELENGKIKNLYTNNLSKYYRCKETGVSDATDIFTMWVNLNNFLLKNNLGDVTTSLLTDICQKFIKENYNSFKDTPIESISIIKESNQFVQEENKKFKVGVGVVAAGLTIGAIYKKMRLKKF
jgi:hypothetical protein